MDNFKFDLFSYNVRYILLIEYPAFKVAFGISCISDDTAHIGMLRSLKDGFQARLFLQQDSLSCHTLLLMGLSS